MFWLLFVLVISSLTFVSPIFALPDEVELGIVFEQAIGQDLKPLVFIVLDPKTDDEVFEGSRATAINMTLNDLTGGSMASLFVDSESNTIGRVLVFYDIIEKSDEELLGLEGLATLVDLRSDRSDLIKAYDVKGIANLRENTLMLEGKYEE